MSSAITNRGAKCATARVVVARSNALFVIPSKVEESLTILKDKNLEMSSTSLEMTKKVTLRALISFAEGARETPRLVTDVSVGRNAPENPTLLKS
jgi:hypothetical protein